MIGNDVVDLQVAMTVSNWRRKGFLEKICSRSERDFILSSTDPDLQVWVLWSMKEAVYKAWNRVHRRKEYAPSTIDCVIKNEDGPEISGTVFYHENVYTTRTVTGADFVHTTAQTDCDDSRLKSCLVRHYPSDYAVYLSDHGKIPVNNIIVKDDLGIPYLWDTMLHTSAPLSISHHGIFLGIVQYEK